MGKAPKPLPLLSSTFSGTLAIGESNIEDAVFYFSEPLKNLSFSVRTPSGLARYIENFLGEEAKNNEKLVLLEKVLKEVDEVSFEWISSITRMEEGIEGEAFAKAIGSEEVIENLFNEEVIKGKIQDVIENLEENGIRPTARRVLKGLFEELFSTQSLEEKIAYGTEEAEEWMARLISTIAYGKREATGRTHFIDTKTLGEYKITIGAFSAGQVVEGLDLEEHLEQSPFGVFFSIINTGDFRKSWIIVFSFNLPTSSDYYDDYYDKGPQSPAYFIEVEKESVKIEVEKESVKVEREATEGGLYPYFSGKLYFSGKYVLVPSRVAVLYPDDDVAAAYPKVLESRRSIWSGVSYSREEGDVGFASVAHPIFSFSWRGGRPSKRRRPSIRRRPFIGDHINMSLKEGRKEVLVSIDSFSKAIEKTRFSGDLAWKDTFEKLIGIGRANIYLCIAGRLSEPDVFKGSPQNYERIVHRSKEMWIARRISSYLLAKNLAQYLEKLGGYKPGQVAVSNEAVVWTRPLPEGGNVEKVEVFAEEVE